MTVVAVEEVDSGMGEVAEEYAASVADRVRAADRGRVADRQRDESSAREAEVEECIAKLEAEGCIAKLEVEVAECTSDLMAVAAEGCIAREVEVEECIAKVAGAEGYVEKVVGSQDARYGGRWKADAAMRQEAWAKG